jgi:hypothetical protein
MKPHTTANEFAPANAQTAHAAVNTATTRPATFAKRFALPGLAALSLLVTGVLAAIETQKETTLSTTSEAMAGDACFKVEGMRYDKYLTITGKEHDEWEPYFCPRRVQGKLCSERRNKRFRECPEIMLERCVDGDEYKNCDKVWESCPKGEEVVSCIGGIWFEGVVNIGPITECTNSHFRGVGSGKCEKK